MRRTFQRQLGISIEELLQPFSVTKCLAAIRELTSIHFSRKPIEMVDSNDEYVLITGDAGAARLALLHETYGASTEALLRELGLSTGMRVADLGCGTGTVSRWLARQVGPEGEVVGVDISTEQLEVATRIAAQQGLPQLRHVQANVYDTGLPRAHFDLVYCRFLLCHVGDPAAGVREMRALLKPGGVLLCEDVDVGSVFCDPPVPLYDRMRDLMLALGRSRGVDYCLGPRLHRIFRSEGFAQPEVRIDQPVFSQGEPKRFWEVTFLEAAPGMLKAGLTDADELRRLTQAMADAASDENVMVAQARKVQVWGRRA